MKSVRVVFLLVAAGLVFGALAGAAVTWDGGYYLFRALDQGTPYVPHERWVNLPIQWIVLAVSQLTRDPQVLIAVFGLVYVGIVLGSMALGWWIVRDEARGLFIWMLLGTGLALLPGFFTYMTEALIVVIVFWPVLLGTLVRSTLPKAMVMVAITMISPFIHPFSIPMTLCAAGMALLVGARHRALRRGKWLWMFWFIVVAIVSVVRFMNVTDSYETERLTLDALRSSYELSIAGLPLVALSGAVLAGSAVLAGPWLARSRGSLPGRIVQAIELGSAIVVASSLTLWAGNSRWWGAEIAFRTWTFFATLPFIGLALLDGFRSDSEQTHTEAQWRHRRRTSQVAAAVFLLVMCVQSLSWAALNHDLQATLAQSPTACVPLSVLSRALGTGGTALGHWSVTPYSLLIQGDSPSRVVLSDELCEKADFEAGLPIASWDLRAWEGGAYDLSLLRDGLTDAKPAWHVEGGQR